MKEITIKLYEFDELSDEAKEKARDWYRQGAFDYDWWSATYEDAERIGLRITSFDLDRNKHAKGQWLSGLGRSASGVSSARLILKEHGDTCETHKDAKAFLKEVEALDESAEDYEDKLDVLDTEFLKTILEDYASLLQEESEYMVSQEVVDDSIRANGYTFTEDGKRHD